jgi:hypothetical protein
MSVVRMPVAVYYIADRVGSDGTYCRKQSLTGFRCEMRIKNQHGVPEHYKSRVPDGVTVRAYNSGKNSVCELYESGIVFGGKGVRRTPRNGGQEAKQDNEILAKFDGDCNTSPKLEPHSTLAWSFNQSNRLPHFGPIPV